MDTVFIESLEVDTVIGAYDWERTIRQNLLVDVQMGWDNRPCAADDALHLALDYAAVSEKKFMILHKTVTLSWSKLLLSAWQLC